MDPFASSNQLDPQLQRFIGEASDRLCSWFAETEKFAPLPVSMNLPDIEIPTKGLSREALIDDLQVLMQGAYRPSHPGSIAHLDPPSLTSSIVADLISAGLNNNLLATELSPSFSKLEHELCKWFANRLGMPLEAGGILANGGSITNLMALVIARHKAGLHNDPKAVVFASSDAHVSLTKATSVMGLFDDSLRKVSTNDEGQISIESLQKDLQVIRQGGRKCFAVVATAGTTVRGAIDSISDLADFCLREGLWLHVDGAIGGVFALNKSTAELVKGIELANSVSLNPQKILGVAKSSSLLLMAKYSDFISTFGTQMPYVEPSGGETFHGGETGLQGTRPADVLKLWLGMRQLGEEGVQFLLENSINRRSYFQELLDISKLNVISGPLHLIACTPKNVDNTFNARWSVETRKYLLENKIMLSRPFYRGLYYLKAVLGNPNTQRGHLEELSIFLNKSVDI